MSKTDVSEKWLWIDGADLDTEKRQLVEEGRDITKVRARLNALRRKSSEELRTAKLVAR